jgi:hypothetical protein
MVGLRCERYASVTTELVGPQATQRYYCINRGGLTAYLAGNYANKLLRYLRKET